MSVTENLKKVVETIDSVKREPVTLIAVTKNHGVEVMREAIDAGIKNIGENRIQEATEKFETLDRQVTKHLIGHLQTNKVKPAIKNFDLIHSVDSVHLAAALNKAAETVGKIQDILIQVNLAKEDSKSGVYEENLPELVAAVYEMKNLRLRGLMMIAPNFPNVEDCRPLFRQMRKIFDTMKKDGKDFEFLSMGMTHDYKIAVEEGANMVRVGTAIFGERNYDV